MRVLPLVLAVATTAAAGTAAWASPYGESDKSASLNLRLGAYQPRIDSSFSRSASDPKLPYEQIFNNDSPMMFLLNIEQHIFNTLGTLSLGMGVGYWSVEGTGVSDGGEDTTLLRMVPMQAQLSYRLDIWEEYLPLVPVVRLGVDYNWWSIEDGTGETASFPGQGEASSTTWGWHATAGLHVLLDFLDDGMASDFDAEAGVNNSYLVFEINYARISDFGSEGSFRLGDTTFFTGLAFDL
jgi:hypothetical protein